MSLNIKNPETDSLIRELAAIKGVSLTEAITTAVKNEVKREQSLRLVADQRKKSRLEWLDEYSKNMAPLFRDGHSGNDLINELYDEETGLPK